MSDHPNLQQQILDHLRPFGLTKGRDGKYRSNSPLRPGSNSLAFSIALDDAYRGGGKYFDHVTGDSGNFLELARALGLVEFTSIGGVPSRSLAPTVYADLAAYARAQGVEPEVFTKAGWRDGEFFCPRHGKRRRAAIFPTATGERARFLDGAKPKYMHGTGYQRCWYGLDRAVRMAEATGEPLVICNGEASVVVAQHYGVAACAVAGGGENGIPGDLVDELGLWYTGTVLIALDCDAAGRRGAQRMLQALTEAGFAEMRAVDLEGGKGFDLANHCKLYTVEAMSALSAKPDAPAEPSPSDYKQLYEQSLERIAELEMILRERTQNVDGLRDRNVFVTDTMARRDIPLAARNVLMASKSLIESTPPSRVEPDGMTPLSRDAIAEATGLSPSTAGRRLNQIAKAGYLDKELRHFRDPETGEVRSRIVVKPVVPLDQWAEFRPPEEVMRTHGGKRVRCRSCGSEDVVELRQRFCRACGEAQEEPRYVPVNPSESEEEPMAEVLTRPQGEECDSGDCNRVSASCTPVEDDAAEAGAFSSSAVQTTVKPVTCTNSTLLAQPARTGVEFEPAYVGGMIARLQAARAAREAP